ncbi:MAG: glutamine--fructose-6-phosphate transaminase (isomerizing) [bacterium]|nr:glutamine--fructose-6-phosphate transaminase (isomerizing) [bacterium]MDZ4284839.1 glutamine--fructose-6-phosphate transaminase (isomerizing) [Patescibacteria group bacterium]
MCGICGHIGTRDSVKEILTGLDVLSYRGYESAGIGVEKDGRLVRVRSEGTVDNLARKVRGTKEIRSAHAGIGHTRWPTHGKPTEANAHPHASLGSEAQGEIDVLVVHNGIIENYRALRLALQRAGRVFTSETDTEVLPNLIALGYEGDLFEAVRRALLGNPQDGFERVKGTYAILVLHRNHPDEIIAACFSSPLVVGSTNGEMYAASDITALGTFGVREVSYLEDEYIVRLTRSGVERSETIHGREVELNRETIDWSYTDVSYKGYHDPMEQEIFTQPRSLQNALHGRIDERDATARFNGLMRKLESGETVLERLSRARRIIFTGCGTSYYAALYAEMVFDKFLAGTGVVIDAMLASEMRYGNKCFDRDTVVWGLSQSGETQETADALRSAALQGALILGLVNVPGTKISRMTTAGIYNHAGPEIGVASTKVFTSQCLILAAVALELGRLKRLSLVDGMEIIEGLRKVPTDVGKVLAHADEIRSLAREFVRHLPRYHSVLFIGRKYHYPMALEGALKLKEVSYVHAEGCAAGEMKHGFIAMLDRNFPTVALVGREPLLQSKMFSNIEEVKRCSSPLIVIATEGNTIAAALADHLFYTPQNLDFLEPIYGVVAMQLFAHAVARAKRLNPDKPRQLAKSVTVE